MGTRVIDPKCLSALGQLCMVEGMFHEAREILQRGQLDLDEWSELGEVLAEMHDLVAQCRGVVITTARAELLRPNDEKV